MTLQAIRTRGGSALLLGGLVLYAVAMAWLLRLPCRVADGTARFPGLCAAPPAPAAGGGLLTGGPAGEAPALVGMVTTVVGWFTTNLCALLGLDAEQGVLAQLPVLLLVLVWAATVAAVLRATGRRTDALVMAVAPAVLLAGFGTWDLWAVLFMVLALLSHDRGHGAAAGVLLGLGASVALFPVAVLLAVLLLAARHRQFRDFLRVLLGAVLTWALVNGPSVLTAWERWTAGLAAMAQRPVEESSLWGTWSRTASAVTGAPPAPAGEHVLPALALGLVAVLVLTLVARQEPDAAQVAFLVLAVFVLLGPRYSLVQVLWLTPLVVLSRQRWPEFAAWQLVELLHWLLRAPPEQTWPALAGTVPGAQDLLGVLRVLFLACLVVVVAVDVLRGRGIGAGR